MAVAVGGVSSCASLLLGMGAAGLRPPPPACLPALLAPSLLPCALLALRPAPCLLRTPCHGRRAPSYRALPPSLSPPHGSHFPVLPFPLLLVSPAVVAGQRGGARAGEVIAHKPRAARRKTGAQSRLLPVLPGLFLARAQTGPAMTAEPARGARRRPRGAGDPRRRPADSWARGRPGSEGAASAAVAPPDGLASGLPDKVEPAVREGLPEAGGGCAALWGGSALMQAPVLRMARV
jgi:hypothetical protein